MNGVEKFSDAPLRALAAAHLGETKLAHALIDATPTDCVLCLRVRGEIDAIEHNWSGGAYWFTRTSAAAPSIPFADSDWGAMLMRRRSRRRHHEVYNRQPERPALCRSAGDVG